MSSNTLSRPLHARRSCLASLELDPLLQLVGVKMAERRYR
jgi:hypothetical protein